MPRLPRLRATPLFENTGSTARDHLASERTFLAWMRTGLGFTALGIAVERFSQLDPSLSPQFQDTAGHRRQNLSEAEVEALREREHLLVGALLGMGGGSIVYGVTRYFSNLRLLEQGLFRPSYYGAAGLAVGVAGLAGGAYVGAVRERIRGREESREHGNGSDNGRAVLDEVALETIKTRPFDEVEHVPSKNTEDARQPSNHVKFKHWRPCKDQTSPP